MHREPPLKPIFNAGLDILWAMLVLGNKNHEQDKVYLA